MAYSLFQRHSWLAPTHFGPPAANLSWRGNREGSSLRLAPIRTKPDLGWHTVPGEAWNALRAQGREAARHSRQRLDGPYGDFCTKKSATRFRAIGVNLILLQVNISTTYKIVYPWYRVHSYWSVSSAILILLLASKKLYLSYFYLLKHIC